MYDLEGISGWLNEDITKTPPRAVELGLRYWNNGLTLSEFRRHYETTYDPWFSDATLKDEFRNGSEDMKYVFFTPEVIVPGPIVGDSVRWAASKITLRDVDL